MITCSKFEFYYWGKVRGKLYNWGSYCWGRVVCCWGRVACWGKAAYCWEKAYFWCCCWTFCWIAIVAVEKGVVEEDVVEKVVGKELVRARLLVKL